MDTVSHNSRRSFKRVVNGESRLRSFRQSSVNTYSFLPIEPPSLIQKCFLYVLKDFFNLLADPLLRLKNSFNLSGKLLLSLSLELIMV